MNEQTDGQLDLLGGFIPQSEASPAVDPQAQRPPVSVSEGSSPAPGTGPDQVLIIDTETTGLDPSEDHCLEIGAILFSVPSRAVLCQQSFLLPVENNAAESINQIPAAVTQLKQPWKSALQHFEDLLQAADVLVAHNAAFDRQWFGRGVLPQVNRPWLCTMDDIRWPSALQLRPRPSVRDLALAHEIPVWAAHRALTDCIYIAEVFRRCEDLDNLLVAGLQPRTLMRARVSYEDRHLAREAGFRWNDPVKGAWSRRISAEEADALPFPVVAVEPHPECASA